MHGPGPRHRGHVDGLEKSLHAAVRHAVRDVGAVSRA
jgi:hypothetical protein